MQIQIQHISPTDFTRTVQPGMLPLFQYDTKAPFAIPKRVLKNWSEAQPAVKRGAVSGPHIDYNLEEGIYLHLVGLYKTKPYLFLGLKELCPVVTLCHDVPDILPIAKRAFERVLDSL